MLSSMLKYLDLFDFSFDHRRGNRTHNTPTGSHALNTFRSFGRQQGKHKYTCVISMYKNNTKYISLQPLGNGM